MSTTTTSGTLFTPELVTDLFSKVQGHSTLAKLCDASPMPFAGTEQFIFSMDGEASIVGEGLEKPPGNAKFGTKTIKPFHKPEGSITGAPWGATNATINWLG